jgi:predicted transcriptional regulator
MSKTKEAIKLVEQGMTVYAACKQLGLSRSAVSRAIARKEENKDRLCPCCGQVVRDQEMLEKIKEKA